MCLEYMERSRRVKILPSKSYAHRAYICAALMALQGGVSSKEAAFSKVVCAEYSDDMMATINCLEAILNGGNVVDLPCQESGSTFRFLIPVLGALGISGRFHIQGRLAYRPLSPLAEVLEEHGMVLSQQGRVPYEISGQLKAGTYILPGDVSSQYISGLLMALPLLSGDSVVMVTGDYQSADYVEMTLDVLADFGIVVEVVKTSEETVYRISGGQRFYRENLYLVEGDWSNAAFWLVASTMAEQPLTCEGLSLHSKQGDRSILSILSKFGCALDIDACGAGRIGVTAYFEGDDVYHEAIYIDVRAIPDLVPALALLATQYPGEVIFTHAERLKFKESNRLQSIYDVLSTLGAKIAMTEDGLHIHGGRLLSGGRVFCHHDHRIVMMAAVASLVCQDLVVIEDWQAVHKSYPRFFEEMERLGLIFRLELV